MILLDNKTKPWIKLYNDPRCVKARQEIQESFKDLIFDEGPHTYTLNGVQIPSVSSMVEKFVEPFDSKAKAAGCYAKYFNDPTSEYYQMTPGEIEKKWIDNAKNATDKGTIAHAFGESCMHYFVGEYDKILPEYQDRLTADGKFIAKEGFEIAIAKFWQDLPDEYVPILAEQRVYARCGTDKVLYAGTFDLLIYSVLPGKQEGLVQFDWKTNADLYKNFKGQRMLRGLENLLDNACNHYEIQQCLYENSINEIGMKVLGKRLIWIKENETYELVRLKEKILPIVLNEIRKDAAATLELPF